MVERESARIYLQQRIAAHDLGVDDGTMDADTVAISTMLLDIDRRFNERMDEFGARLDELESRLDVILERLNRRCCWWLGAALGAIADNKGAIALVVTVTLTALAAVADSILRILRGGR